MGKISGFPHLDPTTLFVIIIPSSEPGVVNATASSR